MTILSETNKITSRRLLFGFLFQSYRSTKVVGTVYFNMKKNKINIVLLYLENTVLKRGMIILFLCFLNVILFAQTVDYHLNTRNKSLNTVIMQLENDLGILFSYKPDDIADVKISANIKSDNYAILMEAILTETDLQFEIVDENFIVIRKKVAPEKISISGSVTDAESQMPLPLANIIVQGKNIGTYTNDDGSFSLDYTFTGKEKISVSYVGYEERMLDFSEFTQNKNLEIALSYPSVKEAFIVITDYLTDGVSVEHNGASTELKPQLVGNLAGSVEPDVLPMIQFLPGIASPSSRVSDVYIRGCTPDQNLMIWEDIPVYHSAHYFGMISAFNPFIIEEMKIYRGGFDATYGGRIAGVIELESGDENSYREHIGTGVNMTHTQAYLHQKIGEKKPMAVTFSLRRSFNELLETPTFKNYSRYNQQGFVLGSDELYSLSDRILIKSDFYFVDTHLKFSGKLDKKNRIEVAGTYTINDFEGQIEDSGRYRIQQDDLYLNNFGVSAKWQHQWNERWQTEVKAAATDFQFDYDYNFENTEINESISSGKKANEILDQQFSIRQIYEKETAQKWVLGYDLMHYNIDSQVDELARHQDTTYIDDSRSNLHALYAHYQNPIDNKIGVQAGLRLGYYDIKDKRIRNTVHFEPRIRLDYRLSKALSFHVNYGRHHQVVGQVVEFQGNHAGINTPIWVLAERESIDVQRANIYQIGAIFQRKSWVIDVQAYIRQIEGLSSRAYDFEWIESGKPITGDAYVRGLDVLVKKRFGKLRSWVSYSLSRADFTFKDKKDDIDLVTFPSDYDQRHIVHWSNQVRANNWQLALGIKAASGLPYTKMIDFKDTSSGALFRYKPIYGELNGEQLPMTSSIDLSATYRFEPKHRQWRIFTGFSIVNLLNQKNVYARSYTVPPPRNGQDTNIESADKVHLGITPNFSFRVAW